MIASAYAAYGVSPGIEAYFQDELQAHHNRSGYLHWQALHQGYAYHGRRYSALAGFTEVGETLEQTVVRETFEEAGVTVDADSLRMVASALAFSQLTNDRL